jgi:hypothetical protein
MQPNEAIVAIVSLLLVGAVTWPLARAIARRIEGRAQPAPSLPPDTAERMARMEAALESVAIEVERISEGQRFVTKLLAEKHEDRRLPPGGAS